MPSFNYLTAALLLVLSALGDAVHATRKPANAVLLSKVQSLTLRNGLKTSHRRVSAMSQLNCIGGSGKGHYDIDVLRCENSGAEYSDEDIQWTCKASLPPEFKLGSTDVICEGYDSPDDPYILKGSCGVEYRLVLTELGEEKYGRKKTWFGSEDSKQNSFAETDREKTMADSVVGTVFWVLFFGVLIYMAYSLWQSLGGNNPGPAALPVRPGGGGGGWGGGDDNDPPPPYDPRPPRKTQPSFTTGDPAQQGWRPGFWSGLMGGAAAGYAAGSRNTTRGPRTTTREPERSNFWGSGTNTRHGWDNGEGNSGRSSSSYGTASPDRYESTGFGSTTRR